MADFATPKVIRRVKTGLDPTGTPTRSTPGGRGSPLPTRKVLGVPGSASRPMSPAPGVIPRRPPSSAARQYSNSRTAQSPITSRPPSSLGMAYTTSDHSNYNTRPPSSMSSRSTGVNIMTNIGGTSADNVVVSVRLRPPLQQTMNRAWEHDEKTVRSIGSQTGGSTAAASAGGLDFAYDHVFAEADNNAAVYERSVRKLVRGVVDGFHGTVFAYGMTGTGKTYSMLGTAHDQGIIPLALQDVFAAIAADTDNRYTLRASYLEIYNERIKDLLNTKSADDDEEIKLREDPKRGIYAYPVTELPVTDLQGFLAILEQGDRIRHSAATDFNAHSSRSHAVVQVVIESLPAVMDASLSRQAGTAKLSTLNLIDLAGSEKAASDSERRKEGAYINKSLLTLGTVIARLTSGAANLSHVPFRDSKLTRLLQNALSGLNLVSILATAHLDPRFVGETTNTLKFAARAKFIPAQRAKKAELFGGDTTLLVASLRSEISVLRVQLFEAQTQLAKHNGLPPPSAPAQDLIADDHASPSTHLLSRITALERDRSSSEDYIRSLESRLSKYETVKRPSLEALASHARTGSANGLVTNGPSPMSPTGHGGRSSSLSTLSYAASPRSPENFSLPSRLSSSGQIQAPLGRSLLSAVSTLTASATESTSNSTATELQEQDRLLAQRVLDESQRSRDHIRDLSAKLDRFKRREEERAVLTPTKNGLEDTFTQARALSPIESVRTARESILTAAEFLNSSNLVDPPPVPRKDPPSPVSVATSTRKPIGVSQLNGLSVGKENSPPGTSSSATASTSLLNKALPPPTADSSHHQQQHVPLPLPPPLSAGTDRSSSPSPSISTTSSSANTTGPTTAKKFKIKAGHLLATSINGNPNTIVSPVQKRAHVTVVSPKITPPRDDTFI
ncbi:Kinesin-like protein kip2 [Savitreella phatthalungensis]